MYMDTLIIFRRISPATGANGFWLRYSTGQLHGEMYTLKNQKLACHIHISTVILPLQSEKNTVML
jgi:hypothetical protein